MPTSVLEIIRRKKLESAIEDLLFSYPYLISPELKLPLRQTALAPGSRSDLLFIFPRRVSVVEIKRDTIDVCAVKQIQRYLGLLSKKYKHLNGYLIGSELLPNAANAIKRSHWKIEYKELNRDIPLQISVCADCRLARDRRSPTCVCGSAIIL